MNRNGLAALLILLVGIAVFAVLDNQYSNRSEREQTSQRTVTQNSDSESSNEASPIEMMTEVFEGNPSKYQIRNLVNKIINEYDMPDTEKYQEKIGSVAVSLNKKYGVPEMDILRCTLESDYSEMNRSGKGFSEAAAICVTAQK